MLGARCRSVCQHTATLLHHTWCCCCWWHTQVRKLEFLMAEAKQQQADCVIT